GQVGGLGADHHAQLDLPVDLLRARRDLDVVVGADDGVGVLVEQDRHRGRFRPGLRGVRGIVLADAQHGLRAGDGGADALRLRALPDGQLTGGERLAHPRDAVAGEEVAVDLPGEVAEAVGHPLADDSRLLLAQRAQTSQFHGHSVHDRARTPSLPGRARTSPTPISSYVSAGEYTPPRDPCMNPWRSSMPWTHHEGAELG